MNEYKITFKLRDTAEFTTYIDSVDEIKEFAEMFNEQFQDSRSQYVNFVGEEPYIMINKSNVLYYTIELENDKVDGIPF